MRTYDAIFRVILPLVFLLLGIIVLPALYEQVVETLSDLMFSGDADQSIVIQAFILAADFHRKGLGVLRRIWGHRGLWLPSHEIICLHASICLCVILIVYVR
jgi:hypothetical protein